MDVTKAIHLLKEKGFKYTDKRKDMLQVFANELRYISAKDVQETLKPHYPGLSFDTIYRNLSTFSELGILEETELDGEKKFRFKCPTSEHHHHLICLTCGKTKEVAGCPMEQLPVNDSGFTVTGHKFEIYGYCQACSL
ncbi:FUR family transcriptional regulator [Fictibacillus macauensis ZFHKF-1]|uniref:FUR family transcriptional regulator n=1 Tax=Fictibacillus macauensis ZFHKF-1 TaxID=1196324 RepID=I8AI94_9BACL|nr:Fur family transcriptional regulator [Fictibacillus macauensis]EIT85189.1 FUR family transcriptional regulator [Fictibacillus macauensis ZFHKF-1]